MSKQDSWIYISISKQLLACYEQQHCIARYVISTGKNGVGELENSGCTPRGWHEVADIIGLDCPMHAVFVSRRWTGEIYSSANQDIGRDWILSRVIRLFGLETGFNQGPGVDTFDRMIYIHGTSDEANLGLPMSHGCVRMGNQDVIELANWVKKGMRVYIDEFFQEPFPPEINNWSIKS